MIMHQPECWPGIQHSSLGAPATRISWCFHQLHLFSPVFGVSIAGVGPSSARPSTDQRRVSGESARSAGADSGSTRSRRSSFALECASYDANRSSLEAFGPCDGQRSSCDLIQVCLVVPPHLQIARC